MNNAAQDCSYCYSPPVMVDVPRLTAALLLRFGDAVPIDTPVQLWAFDCLGCGQALDPTVDIRCPQRDQSVALPQLHLLTPLLNHVEPVLLGRMPYRQWWRGDLQLAATYLRNLSTENARHLQEGFA